MKLFIASKKFIFLIIYAVVAVIAAQASEFQSLQIDGKPNENVSFSQFKLWLPPKLHPSRLLVLVWGSSQSSLEATNDPGWQTFSKSLDCGILSCRFVPSDSDSRWDQASRGSGRCLLEALKEFAEAVNDPALAKAKLLLIGDSQGGQFAYHFATWDPKESLAFVSLKGGYHDISLAPKAAQVPRAVCRRPK